MSEIPGDSSDSSAARLISLLDHAYEAAELPEAYDDLFVDADAYFFPRSAEDGLAADLPSEQDLSPVLSRHLDRIQTVIDRAELDQASHIQHQAGPRLASLVVSEDGATVIGNKVSESLMGCTFPMPLEELPISGAAMGRVQGLLETLRSGQFEGARTLVVQVVGHTISLVAKCIKLQSVGVDGQLKRALSITISHVDWDSETLEFARQSFDLSLAEVQLLHNFLQGASQAEAAENLGKSRETIKAQAKAILRKSGQQQMSDVLNFVTSYAYLASTDRSANTSAAPETVAVPGNLVLSTEEGRRVEVHRYGLEGGNAVLFVHGLYQGPFFSERMSDEFHAAGLDVIAPSRPGFARTDAPADWTDFYDQTTRDAVAVCDHFDLQDITLLVHQAGVSFACRAAGALGGRFKGALMVGAGVPIEDHMMSTMNLETRIAAAGVRYAPTMFDMLLRVGIAKWRRSGARAYLEHYFGPTAPEWETIQDPELGPLMERGIHHMISQGSRTIIEDGRSAMSDWEPEYDRMTCPQVWMHGKADPVMNYRFVAEFLARKGQAPPILYAGVGGDLLYAEFDDVLARLVALSGGARAGRVAV